MKACVALRGPEGQDSAQLLYSASLSVTHSKQLCAHPQREGQSTVQLP